MSKKVIVSDIFNNITNLNNNKNNSSEVGDLSSGVRVSAGVGEKRANGGGGVNGGVGRVCKKGKEKKQNDLMVLKTPEDVINKMSEVCQNPSIRTFEKKTQMDYLAKLYDVLVREEERRLSKGSVKTEREPIKVELIGKSDETNDRIKKLEKEVGLTDELRA